MTDAEFSGETTLVVSQRIQAADGIAAFELRRPDGGELAPFTAGAHLTVQAPNGEWRKYSLTNDPIERDRYCIAVKREAEGRGGSVAMTDRLQPGDRLAAIHPKNDFPLQHNRGGYLFIAGGIGITPILSMIRHLRTTAGAPFKLYYLSRSRETSAFLSELSAPEFRGRVTIHHDHGDPSRAFDLWPVLAQPKPTHLYCCGPRALMQAVRDMTGHWSSAAVHFESFTDGAATHRADDRAFAVRLQRSERTITVPADLSILAALRAEGVALPSSCESGTCGTCKTRLLSGEADHRDLVLSDEERASHIMVCVSRARSDELVLDL